MKIIEGMPRPEAMPSETTISTKGPCDGSAAVTLSVSFLPHSGHSLFFRLQMAFIGGIGGPWSPDKIVAETPWRHKKLLAGGGGAIDIGVHAMHWLRYVCGEVDSVQGMVRTFEPVRVLRDEAGEVVEKVTADVDDTYLATVSFANGAIGQMMWSWAGHGAATGIPNGPVFYGAKGSLHGDDLYLADGQKQSAKALFEAELDEVTRAEWFPHGFTDPFAIQQLDWLQAIERGGQPETDGEEGLRDLAAAFAIIESARLGRRVSLEEILQGEVAGYQAEIDDYYGL
jgi:predicted dehydrogenase